MRGEYLSFNQLLKNAMVRIDESQKENSKAQQEFREKMRELFSDPDMFNNTTTTIN